MKIFLLSLLFLCLSSRSLHAAGYLYRVQEGDQLGSIYLSLGHNKLWAPDGKINQLLLNPQNKSKLYAGSLLDVLPDDVIFKHNVQIDEQYIQIKKRIYSNAEFNELAAHKQEEAKEEIKVIQETENQVPINSTSTPTINEQPEVVIEPKEPNKLALFVGLGFFLAYDDEKNRSIETTTFSGLQPLIQLKGLYEHSKWGAVVLNLMTKQISNTPFAFPVNIDYRLQFLPKYRLRDSLQFFLTHSFVQHSYVGKNNVTEIAHKLDSQFLGLGFRVPFTNFNLDLIFEKAYAGEISSSEIVQDAKSGYRFDAEVIYLFHPGWELTSGFNYYALKNNQTNYTLTTKEWRMALAREFSF